MEFTRPMLNTPVENDLVGGPFLEKVLGRLGQNGSWQKAFDLAEKTPVPAKVTDSFKRFIRAWLGS